MDFEVHKWTFTKILQVFFYLFPRMDVGCESFKDSDIADILSSIMYKYFKFS